MKCSNRECESFEIVSKSIRLPPSTPSKFRFSGYHCQCHKYYKSLIYMLALLGQRSDVYALQPHASTPPASIFRKKFYVDISNFSRFLRHHVINVINIPKIQTQGHDVSKTEIRSWCVVLGGNMEGRSLARGQRPEEFSNILTAVYFFFKQVLHKAIILQVISKDLQVQSRNLQAKKSYVDI